MKITLCFACRLAIAAALLAPWDPISAADTRVLPFQGRLTDAEGRALPDGSRVVQFKIYDAPVGGRAVWNGEVHNLTVNSGLVSTMLGTKAALSGVDFNQDLYLELTIDANADSQISLSDPPLLPRQSIVAAVFSKESGNTRLLDGYDWSALFGTNNPADGTLLESKIADGSVGTAKIRDAAVTSAKIANGAVLRSKLDATGATAGQGLSFNGSEVVWSQIDAINAVNSAFATNAENAVNAQNAANAVNAQSAANANLLDGYDWSSFFLGNPATGTLRVENALVRGNLQLGTFSGDYRRITLGGGNSLGYIYGSYAGLGDGIHLGYNYYWDANGFGRIFGSDGPTSRLSLGYGYIGLYIGGVGSAPNTARFIAQKTGVSVSGTFNNVSDRNAKQEFSLVDPAEILAKVSRLPISEWSYKDDPTTRHIGPVGQDFFSIFKIGTDEKSIAPLDEGGVALAAIQALNRKVEQQEREIQDLRKKMEKLDSLLNTRIARDR